MLPMPFHIYIYIYTDMVLIWFLIQVIDNSYVVDGIIWWQILKIPNEIVENHCTTNKKIYHWLAVILYRLL